MSILFQGQTTGRVPLTNPIIKWFRCNGYFLEIKLKKFERIIKPNIDPKKKINKIGFGEIIDNYFEKIIKIKSNSTILLYGPSGIGKNYIANFIHMKLSSNNPDTFINMNDFNQEYLDNLISIK